MAYLAFENGLRLHADGIRLFQSKPYASAYLISVLSMEEFGKSLALEGYLWKTHGDRQIPWDIERKVIADLYDHKYKQWKFAWNMELPGYCRKVVQDIFDGKAETRKQAATYVGLRRIGKALDYKGKIVNPLKLRARVASDQITVVNDFLLVLALGSIKGTDGLDLVEIDKLFTHRFVKDLRDQWPVMSLSAARQYAQIARFDDLTLDERGFQPA
jgi:AbiV family abortive infection protein